jgi:hypothetical protein
LLEEYYQAIKGRLLLAMVYNFIIADKDVTDILRGKVQILDEILGIKESFIKFEMLDKDVKDEENRLKGAK